MELHVCTHKDRLYSLSLFLSPTSVPVVPKRKKRQTMMGPVEEEGSKLVKIPMYAHVLLNVSSLSLSLSLSSSLPLLLPLFQLLQW